MVICVDPKPVKTIDEAYVDTLLEVHDYLANVKSDIRVEFVTESLGVRSIDESVIIDKIKSAVKFVRGKIVEFFGNIKKKFNEIKNKVKRALSKKAREKYERDQAFEKEWNDMLDEIFGTVSKTYDEELGDFDDFTEKLIEKSDAAVKVADEVVDEIRSKGYGSIEAIQTAAKKAGKRIYKYLNVKTGEEGETDFEDLMGDPDKTLVIG